MSGQLTNGGPALGPMGGTMSPGDLAAGEQRVADNWGWFVALGALLIVLGAMAISYAVYTTIGVAIFCGVMFLFGAGGHLVHAFYHRDWGGFLLSIVLSAFLALAGVFLLMEPLMGAIVYTLILGIMLLIKGGVRIILSFSARRFMGWLAILLSGAITLLLGALILAQWPLSGLFVVGLFVGVDLIMSGASWVALGITASQYRTPHGQQPAPTA